MQETTGPWECQDRYLRSSWCCNGRYESWNEPWVAWKGSLLGNEYPRRRHLLHMESHLVPWWLLANGTYHHRLGRRSNLLVGPCPSRQALNDETEEGQGISGWCQDIGNNKILEIWNDKRTLVDSFQRHTVCIVIRKEKGGVDCKSGRGGNKKWGEKKRRSNKMGEIGRTNVKLVLSRFRQKSKHQYNMTCNLEASGILYHKERMTDFSTSSGSLYTTCKNDRTQQQFHDRLDLCLK